MINGSSRVASRYVEAHCISTNIFCFTKAWRKVLILKIWAPEWRSEDEWQCRWEIEGLYGSAHPAVSNDSWHSLMLAIRTIEQLLSYHSEDGAKLYYEKGGEELLLSDIIPRWAVSNEARKPT